MILVLLAAFRVNAQDVGFSHPYNAPLYTNPALAGATGAGKFATVFRDQWPKLTGGGFTTLYTSYDHYLNKYNTGMGMYFMHDDQGALLKSNLLALALSYTLNLFDEKLRLNPGLDLGGIFKTLDTNGLNAAGQEEYLTKKTLFDIGAGLQATSQRLNLGFVLKHITEPNQSMVKDGTSRLPMKYSGLIDYTFGKIGEKKALKFNFGVFAELQSGFERITGTFVLSWKNLRVGAGYNNSETLILKAAWEGRTVRLRYSYDIYSGYLSDLGGSHEVSTLINLFKKKKKEEFLEMNNFHF